MENYASDQNITYHPDSFSDPETRELAEVLWRLEGLMPSDPDLDWKESRQWNCKVLQELFQSDDKTDRLINLLDGAEYEEGGDEHLLIRVDEQPSRIYKITYGDNFGCYSKFDPIDPELTGKNFNATGNSCAKFYIKRWILLNSIGGYKTRFEGILPPEKPGWLPRICISQPWLDGSNPDSNTISLLMPRAGFIEISKESFYHRDSKILLTDVAPRNARIATNHIIPFDAIAEIASQEVVGWIETKFFPTKD